MRLLAANILSFELDPGQGVPTAPGVPSTVLIAPKRSQPKNRCKRSDRAVVIAPAAKAVTATQDIAQTGPTSERKFFASRFARAVRIRHQGIDNEAG
jgi:hypothetical protein